MLRKRRTPPIPVPVTPDPLDPWKEHDALRVEADAAARHDAGRHAEDLLGRRLPYTDQASSQAQTRLARLEVGRQEALAVLERERIAAERRAVAVLQALEAVGAALEAEGVDARQHALP